MSRTNIVTIQEWPDSQNCMECIHSGGFVQGEQYTSSNYVCLVACTENGRTCPMFARDGDVIDSGEVTDAELTSYIAEQLLAWTVSELVDLALELMRGDIDLPEWFAGWMQSYWRDHKDSSLEEK